MNKENIEVGKLYLIVFKSNYCHKNVSYAIGDIRFALVTKKTKDVIYCLIEKNIVSMMYNEFIKEID